MSGAAEAERTNMAGKILSLAGRLQARRACKRHHGVRLPSANFEDRKSSGGKRARDGRKGGPECGKAFIPGEERVVGFEFANTGAEAVVVLRYVGRIAENEIEWAFAKHGPVGNEEGGARGEAEGLCIIRGNADRCGASVDAETFRLPPLAERREKEASGACAEIDDRLRRALAAFGQRQVDQGLAVGTWDQRVGGNLQGQRPEFGAAGDMGNRFASLPPGKQRVVGFVIESSPLASEHVGARDSEEVRREEFSV